MTQKELFSKLASGDRTVKTKVVVKDAISNVGVVQQVLFFGKDIRLLVLYPGNKFEVAYEDNEQVTYRNVRYLKELE